MQEGTMQVEAARHVVQNLRKNMTDKLYISWRIVSECKQGSTSELDEALSFLFLQPGSGLGS